MADGRSQSKSVDKWRLCRRWVTARKAPCCSQGHLEGGGFLVFFLWLAWQEPSCAQNASLVYFGIMVFLSLRILLNQRISCGSLWLRWGSKMPQAKFQAKLRITTRPLDLAGTRLAPRVFHRVRRNFGARRSWGQKGTDGCWCFSPNGEVWWGVPLIHKPLLLVNVNICQLYWQDSARSYRYS